MKKLSVILFVLCTQMLIAQGLFESAGESSSTLAYDLNGYVKGAYFLGKDISGNNEMVTQSAFGETALKLRIQKHGFGEAFSDIRFRSGYAYGKKQNVLDIREAYLRYELGQFNFAMGKQIVVWGRADGFNPTDMLSVQDMTVMSANEDDKRLGNWMLSTQFRYGIMDLEGVWVPVYQSWNIPFDLLSSMFPIPIQSIDKPNFSIENSALAFRANLQGSEIDGSVSYFSGYNPRPSINGAFTPPLQVDIMPKAYRTHMVGADFQTTLGAFGLRGEFAYTHPFEDYKQKLYLPNPELQWVIGTDRSFGNFMVNVQYIGKWVEDFSKLNPLSIENLANPFNYMLRKQNRMFTAQQHELGHSLSSRLSQKLFKETLDISVFGLYNISTEEYMIRPKLEYQISDAMLLSAGLEYYNGPKETLFYLMNNVLRKAFLELKIVF